MPCGDKDAEIMQKASISLVQVTWLK